MEENRLQEAGRNSGSVQKRLMISILAAAALLMAGLYFMVNQPNNFIVFLVLAVLFLAALYIAVDSVIKLSIQQKISEDAQYDYMNKSEKASYLLMKKTYEDLMYLIEKIDGSKDNDSDRIIISQKAMAKAILNKNKDNTNAVLKLNSDIRNLITGLQDKVEENDRRNQDYQESFTESFHEEIVTKQDRLFIELNNMEASLNNSLLTLSEKVSGFQEEIERLAEHMEKINIDTIDELTKNIALLKEQAAETYHEEVPAAEAQLEETSAAEVPAAEKKTLKEAPAAKEEASDPNKMMTPEDIEALIAGTLDDIGLDLNNLDKDPELPGLDEMLSVETPAEEMKEKELLPEKEPVIEKAPAAAVQEEKAAGPDLSNPNKMMTPEDIAALLASM